jgi:hypothetical protein
MRTPLLRAASYFAGLVLAGAAVARLAGGEPNASAQQPAAGAAGQGSAAPTPTVASVAGVMDSHLHWGMSHQQVIDAFNRPGGIFDDEYRPKLAHMQPGTQMQMVEADENNRRAALAGSYVHFDDDPLGFDSTPIHAEYTYHNNEGMLWVRRLGTKTFLFFFGPGGGGDRFWKVYDEVPLRAGGPLGATFDDAVAKLTQAFNARPRMLQPGTTIPEVGRLEAPTADWQDSTSHVRLIDRSDEHLAGVVIEENSTRSRLVELRPNHPVDPFALDPSTAAVTQHGVSDPNAGRPAASGSAQPRQHH